MVLNDGDLTLVFGVEGSKGKLLQQLRAALITGARVTLTVPLLVVSVDSGAKAGESAHTVVRLRLNGEPKLT